jgi:HK97 family phage prohead protease
MTEEDTRELEYRTAEVVGLSFPKRTIELIVMPYEQEAVVEHRGRLITEIVSRGAFEGIDTRPRRVTVNRDHDVTRTIGRAVAFHPSREDGLVAEVRISQTDLGEETLTLADDGILDASAGFMPKMDRDGTVHEEWPNRNYRRLNKVWLGHIAMTPDPAYVGAKVLAVRSATSTEPRSDVSTPNLDRLKALIRDDRYAALELGR